MDKHSKLWWTFKIRMEIWISLFTWNIRSIGCVHFYIAAVGWESFVVVQSPSCVQLFAIPWTAACQVSLSLTISWSLPKFISIALVMPSSHLLSRPLLQPSIFHSIRDFSNESAVSTRWPKYWSFSFSISPSNEYSGFIFLKIDWFDLLAVQRTLGSLLQHHSSKASILQHSAFFTVQLSQLSVATRRTIALTIWLLLFLTRQAYSSWPQPPMPLRYWGSIITTY